MAPKPLSAARKQAAIVPLSIVGRAKMCAPYGRVSSDIQHEEQTIESQKRILLTDILSRDNPTLDAEHQQKLVRDGDEDGFWDDPCSGTVPFEERPAGRRLVRLLCARGSISCDGTCGGTGAVIDLVWITKLDRLARNLQVLIETEAFFRRHGAGLRCLEFNLNTADPTGELIFMILGAIAHWERKIILQRTATGKHTKAVEGRAMGRVAFGLKKDENGYLVVDDTLIGKTQKMAYEIVQEVFANVIAGSSIEREAERFGISERRIHLMLHNKRYKGEGGMLENGRWLAAERNAPPQLVSPGDWDLAQEKLTENKRFSARNRKREYLVSQLLICHERKEDGTRCGRVFVARTAKQKHVYYCCYRKGCDARPIRGSDIENLVWAEVRKSLLHPDAWLDDALAKGSQTDRVRELRAELSVAIDEISKLDSERLSVLRNVDKGHYTEAEGDARLAEIREKLESRKDQQATLEIQLRSVNKSQATLRRSGLEPESVAAELDRIEAWAQSSDEDEVHRGRSQMTALIKSRIDHIEVRGRKLKLHWLLDEHVDELSIVPADLASPCHTRQLPEEVKPIQIITEHELPEPTGQGRRCA